MNKISSWMRNWITPESEIRENHDKSGIYINAYNTWARIETNLPAERNAQVKRAVDEIVKAVFSEEYGI